VSDNPPSVLAILVVKDGASWVGPALASLGRQTHGRIGVLAVDNASTDGTEEILRAALGPKRVIRLPRDVGFGGAVARALRVPAAGEADYVLLLHDDAALAPDAVERLVETARRVRGAGVVAPKVLDWTRPGVLLEVGRGADRFGYPYTPLEEGEIDHGQYDAPREVLFVSTAAMLLSREALHRVAPPDDRLRGGQPELDFCWRVRLAGYRVLVDPRAVVMHRLAGERGERAGSEPERERYLAERAGLLALLKSYRLLTLLWILPLYAIQGIGRFLFYLLSRHGDRSWEIARAWGWNLVHLPGTLRRRWGAQRSRRVRDREIGRFMTPAGSRLQRWAVQASSLLVARRAEHVEDEEEPEAPPLPARVASVVAAHPVAIGWLVAVVATLVAFRDILFVPASEGGSLGVLPDGPMAFFREFASPWRGTGFGGDGAASPALVLLGAGSFLALGEPMLLVRLLVALTPLLAGISAYGAVVRVTREPGPAVLSAACYALSAVGLWSASEGSLPAIVLLIGTPWLALRLAGGFGRAGPPRPFRWIVATAAVVALAGSFFPAIWIAAGMLLVPLVLIPQRSGSRVRGSALAGAAFGLAAVLVFPFTVELFRAGGGTEVGAAGRPEFASLLRLSPGPSPGSGPFALFLPVAGVVSFAFAETRARWAARALLTAAAAVPLAWLAAAGHLPSVVSNPLAYLVPGAFALSLLVGVGVRSVVSGARRTAFGVRQAAVGVLVGVLAVGLSLQLLAALGAGWAVGERRQPAAWPVVASAGRGEPFRVLWIGRAHQGRFPAPGGRPQGIVEAGAASVRYAVTGRGGRSILATGQPTWGPGYERLEEALGAILSGRIRHGGSLLAPFAIRFVIAGAGDLPDATAQRLAVQLDMDLVQTAGGLRIYRNARAVPLAGAFAPADVADAATSPELLAATRIDPAQAVPLVDEPGPVWSGRVPIAPSFAYVATSFDERWRVEGGEVVRAFGWAVGARAGQEIRVSFDGGPLVPIQLGAMAIMWAAVLWVVLRPGEAAAQAPPRRAAAATGARAPEDTPPRPAVPQGGRR
jgi:GT2 family glycosyltransferase